jgi:DNA-directed RNA polymerase subunit K/omega
MLFEPPIDEIAERIGNVYTATIIIGARAKELESKIPALLQNSANNAIEYAAKEVHAGKVIAVKVK